MQSIRARSADMLSSSVSSELIILGWLTHSEQFFPSRIWSVLLRELRQLHHSQNSSQRMSLMCPSHTQCPVVGLRALDRAYDRRARACCPVVLPRSLHALYLALRPRCRSFEDPGTSCKSHCLWKGWVFRKPLRSGNRGPNPTGHNDHESVPHLVLWCA